MKSLITIAALAAAFLTVLGTRFVVPALQLIYYSLLQSWAPVEPAAVAAVAALPDPVVVTADEPTSKPRPARRRKPSATTLAKAAAAIA